MGMFGPRDSSSSSSSSSSFSSSSPSPPSSPDSPSSSYSSDDSLSGSIIWSVGVRKALSLPPQTPEASCATTSSSSPRNLCTWPQKKDEKEEEEEEEEDKDKDDEDEVMEREPRALLVDQEVALHECTLAHMHPQSNSHSKAPSS